MVRVQYNEDGQRREERFITNDPRDLVGPPYMVAEHVFDEYSLEGCYENAEEVPR
jgi:hypothetical protein